MPRILKCCVLLAALGPVAGCIQDPRDYETDPVTVTVAKGTVTCQLYTRQMVYWDRATDWPRSMSADEADAVCLEQGKKWQRGELDKPTG